MKNKNLLLTIIVFFGLAITSNAQNIPNYVPDNGLIGWWPFNGNANDESGNGNHGTLIGNVSLTTDRDGLPNSAFSFPGNSSAYIDVNQNNSFANFSDGFTISAWYLSNVSSTSGRVIALGNTDSHGGSNGNGFHIAGFNTTGIVLRIGSIPISIGQWNSAIQGQSSAIWHNLVLTANFSNNNYKIYHNGLEIENDTISSALPLPIDLSTQNFNIGRKTVSAFDPWNGKVDDIGIWNRALTAQEVSNLYNGCAISVIVQPDSQQININNNVIFYVASSDSSATYQWQTDLGTGFQNLNSAGQYSGTTSDTLIVANVTMNNDNQPFRCIISSGSCSDTSNVALLTVNNNIGIDKFLQDNLIFVYPNPVQSIINVRVNSILIGKLYKITDNSGRVVLSGQIRSENNIIDLSDLANGVYHMNVDNKMKQQFKILKN